MNPTVAKINSSGYVTGVSIGTTSVSLVTSEGTTSATITVGPNSSVAIIDPIARPYYKFDNSPHGPVDGVVNYMGYNGFNYSSQARPINTGFYRASNQSGNEASCPFEYYIMRCNSCTSVPENLPLPQGSLSGSTVYIGTTGQLTYTSNNFRGPFTIVYQPTGGSIVTVTNVASGVAFNVASGTPSSTTSYTLVSVTDEASASLRTTGFTTSTATITIKEHYIGESFGGGIVFYVTDGGAHGLIAATVDQGAIRWHNDVYNTTGATSTAIGTGLANTNTIITKQGEIATSYAAGLARAYRGGLYSDWYLPSKNELNLMYTYIGQGNSLNVAPLPNTNIGNFSNGSYWSSSERDINNAWLQGFYNGQQINATKYHPLNVRAIRSF